MNAVTSTYSEAQIDALRELANIGAGNATIALERLIARPIGLDVPEVDLLPVAEAVARAGAPEADRYGIVVPVEGDFQALMLLLLDPHGASVLYGSFGLEPGSPQSRSMLCELGNILSSSYIGSLAKAAGMELAPRPPQLVVDMLAAILATALVGDGQAGDIALLIDSHMTVEGEHCNLEVLLIPAPGAVDALIGRLGVS